MSDPTPSRAERYLPVVCILLVALATRLYGLTAESFWIDETITYWFVTHFSYGELVWRLPRMQPHYPAYYILMKGFVDVTGLQWEATRLLSALVGVATVGAGYWAGATWYDRSTGLVAALLLSVWPFHVYHAQELRMYGLLALATTCSWTALVRYRAAGGRRLRWGYLGATALLVTTHVYGLFAVAGQVAYVAIARYRAGALPAVGPDGRAVATGFALGVPTASVTVLKVLAPGVAGEAAEVGHIETAPTLADLAGIAIALVTQSLFHIPGINAQVLLNAVPTVVVGVLAAATAARHRWWWPDRGVALACWVAVPLGLAVALSWTVKPIVMPRYLIGATIPVALAAAKAVSDVRLPVRPLLLGVVVLALLGPTLALYAGADKPGWQETRAVVDARADCSDAVVLDRTHDKAPAAHYFIERDGCWTVYEAHRGDPNATVQWARERHDTVWLVFSTSDQRHRIAARSTLRATHRFEERWRHHWVVLERYERRES